MTVKMYVDEETGYLIIEGAENGFDILPSELYQSYLKQIKDLQKEVKSTEEHYKGCIDILVSHVKNLEQENVALKERLSKYGDTK